VGHTYKYIQVLLKIKKEGILSPKSEIVKKNYVFFFYFTLL